MVTDGEVQVFGGGGCRTASEAATQAGLSAKFVKGFHQIRDNTPVLTVGQAFSRAVQPGSNELLMKAIVLREGQRGRLLKSVQRGTAEKAVEENALDLIYRVGNRAAPVGENGINRRQMPGFKGGFQEGLKQGGRQ